MLRRLASWTFPLILAAGSAAGQALDVAHLPGGATVVTATLPLADAVSVAWVDPEGGLKSRTASAVTGLATLEEVLGAAQPVPAVLAVTGPLRPEEVRPLAVSLVEGKPVAEAPTRAELGLAEGGAQRRLGPAGSPAKVRLTLPLPAAGDPLRPAAEVLAELLPGALTQALPPVRVRREEERVVLELDAEPELAEFNLDRLRLELGRIAAASPFEAEAVETAAARLAAARTAELEQHPAGAELLVRRWLAGGDAAVRQALFGFAAVDRDRVAEAAHRWLAVHPGSGQLVLPPQALNPQFATPPEVRTLPGGTVVAVLERPTAALSAVCLRPALTPDPWGGRTAVVLARVAAALRDGSPRPAAIRVERNPARLELVGARDGYAELLEALGRALARVAEDSASVPRDRDARTRALELMGVLLGAAAPGELTPARLLAPPNRVVGVVAPDAEAALEAAAKFLGTERGEAVEAASSEIVVQPRRRVAVPGTRSVMAVALEGTGPAGDPVAQVAAELVAARLAGAGFAAKLVTIPTPKQPVQVLVTEGEAQLPELERRLTEAWAVMMQPPEHEELAAAGRRAATREAVRWTGSAGHAALAASVALGELPWRPPEARTMGLLAVDRQAAAEQLARWKDLGSLPTAGAGPLPVSALPLPADR